MENSLISIIVPIYNVEKYIHQCIDSLINQTYKNIEIILVDDGSPDNCGKICDEYARKDKRIKVIHQNNMGLSGARNTGLDNTYGDYITFIDSDDYVALDYIERLYNISIKYAADIVECNFERFDDDNGVNNNLNNKEKIVLLAPEEKQEKLYGKECAKTVIVCNKLYKKYIYYNLRFPVGKIHEDEYTTYKALYNCQTDIAITNLKLYFYRSHNNSIMGKKFSLKRLDVLEGLEERKKFYKSLNNRKLYLKTAKRYNETARFMYIQISKYIENSEKILNQVYKKIYDNCNEIRKSNAIIDLKTKLFLYSPKLFIKIRDNNLVKKIRRM